MKTLQFRKKISFFLPIAILLVISLLNMYGASSISNLYQTSFMKQATWILLGAILMFIVYKIDLNFLISQSRILYILGILSLVLVLFFGKNVNGATSWFKIGPFSVQPSEIFKFFYVLYLAKIASQKDNKFLLLKIIILTFVPCILIFMEPDTGLVLMLLLLMFGILLESDIKKRYIFGLIGIALIFLLCFFLFYFYRSDDFIRIFGTSFFYRIDRILDAGDTSSYQLKNALIGIGASGIFGMGINSEKIYIPEATTDFVFDLTICNFGYLLGIFVVCLYTYFLYRLYKEIGNTKNKTNRLILSSIFYMMFFQVSEHILMNLGLTPITGITLPFLSYGGSSLISYFLLLGLILKIMTKNQKSRV